MTHRHDAVTLLGIHKHFGQREVLVNFDLVLPHGTVVALTGPNGCGKTTVGRLVLGLEQPDAGTVGGVGEHTVSCVFQENRLCGHLSAIENVRLVLSREQSPQAVPALRAMGLPSSALVTPVAALSGGQRRRVAIARALAGDAQLVVLDEPFTGIDAHTKAAAVRYVRERLAGRTALLITHDPSEAAALGARLVRMPVPPPTPQDGWRDPRLTP